MLSNMSVVSCMAVSLLLFAGVISIPANSVQIPTKSVPSRKDAIGFPEAEEDSRLKNKENRLPVYIPAMCNENELYYPGDQKDDWICDCRPAHLYHPGSDRCWPSWRQGPCPEGEYLYLPEKTVIPVCQRNPCHISGYVYFGTKCELLGSTAPCVQHPPIATALGVNATTLQVECIKLTLENRFSEPESETVTEKICPPGTKRSIQKKCVPL